MDSPSRPNNNVLLSDNSIANNSHRRSLISEGFVDVNNIIRNYYKEIMFGGGLSSLFTTLCLALYDHDFKVFNTNHEDMGAALQTIFFLFGVVFTFFPLTIFICQERNDNNLGSLSFFDHLKNEIRSPSKTTMFAGGLLSLSITLCLALYDHDFKAFNTNHDDTSGLLQTIFFLLGFLFTAFPALLKLFNCEVRSNNRREYQELRSSSYDPGSLNNVGTQPTEQTSLTA